MKHSIYALLLVALCLSCKKDKNTDVPEPTTPVSGKLFGVQFTSKVALERYTKFSMSNYTPEDLFAIYLSPDINKSCSSADKDFWIRLTVPKKIGTFSSGDTYILINDPRDPTGQEGALFNDKNTIIEVISITPDKVRGRVDIKGLDAETEFKGYFEAAICK